MDKVNSNVVEGNKLIAEFMQHPFLEKWNKLNTGMGFPYSKFKYESSWSQLMPVVEKIVSMGYFCKMETNITSLLKWRVIIYGTSNECHFTNTKKEELIKVAYPTIIEFIKWHNNNQK